MARITVVATEHPVPLPDGRFVRTAAEEPAGVEVERDIFILRRLAAEELAEIPTAEPAAEVANEPTAASSAKQVRGAAAIAATSATSTGKED